VLENKTRTSILDKDYGLLKKDERHLQQTVPVDQSRASISER
jgi:hypothetical protein